MFCALAPSALARKMSPERAKAILPFSPGKVASAGRARDVPREAANTAAATARSKSAVGPLRALLWGCSRLPPIASWLSGPASRLAWASSASFASGYSSDRSLTLPKAADHSQHPHSFYTDGVVEAVGGSDLVPVPGCGAAAEGQEFGRGDWYPMVGGKTRAGNRNPREGGCLLRILPAGPAAGRGAHAGGAGPAGRPEPQRRRRPGAWRQEASVPAHGKVPVGRPEPGRRREGGAAGGRTRTGGRACRARRRRGVPVGVARGLSLSPGRYPARWPRARGGGGGGDAREARGTVAHAHRHGGRGEDPPRRGGGARDR